MPSTTTHPPSGSSLSLIQSCRHQHRDWSAILDESDQAIDQLLIQVSRLTELPGSENRNPQPIHYVSTLKRLKTYVHRLRVDRVCQNTACLNKARKACVKPRIGPLATLALNDQIQTLTDELTKIKEHVEQFT